MLKVTGQEKGKEEGKKDKEWRMVTCKGAKMLRDGVNQTVSRETKDTVCTLTRCCC